MSTIIMIFFGEEVEGRRHLTQMLAVEDELTDLFEDFIGLLDRQWGVSLAAHGAKLEMPARGQTVVVTHLENEGAFVFVVPAREADAVTCVFYEHDYV